jgi:hypothetical protein
MDRLDNVEKSVAQGASHQPSSHSQTKQGKRRHQSVSQDFDTDQSDNDHSDFELEPAKRPMQQYGALVGDDVRKKLVLDIRSDKFVNFTELLPNPDRERNNSFVFSATSSSDLKIYQRRQKRFITFQQWNIAYDVYMSVYIETALSRSDMSLLIKDMLTYRKEVEALHSSGRDWFNFDHHFRMDRELNHCRFSTVRHDLLRQYDSQQPFRSAERSDQSLKRSQNQNERSRFATVPLGYCRKYHTQDIRCTFDQCKYKHTCPKCSRRHPTYMPCNQASGPRQQPANAAQPQLNQQPNRQQPRNTSNQRTGC